MQSQTLNRDNWRKRQVMIKLQSFNLTLEDIRQASNAKRQADKAESDQRYASRLALHASIQADIADKRQQMIGATYDRSDALLDADIARNADLPDSDIAVIIERAIEATAEEETAEAIAMPAAEDAEEKAADREMFSDSAIITAKQEIKAQCGKQ